MASGKPVGYPISVAFKGAGVDGTDLAGVSTTNSAGGFAALPRTFVVVDP